MDWLSEQLGVSTGVLNNALVSIAVVATIVAARALTLAGLRRQFEEDWDEYRGRKIATYAAVIASGIILAWIWVDAFDNLATFLGLLSAGIAIALADVLKNIAGWAYVLARRPFRIGDRIEVLDTKGDVVDVRLFRFSLMEVGNWVDADQSTGRLIHVPNGVILTNKVANYTEGFEFIWHEVPVLVTFESDRRRAREIIEHAARSHTPEVDRQAEDRVRSAARLYRIKVGTLTPTVYMTVKDSGILYTARFLINPRTRRGVEEGFWTEVLDAFDDEPGIDLAYPTVRTYFAGPVEVQRPPVDTDP